ncbi:MAG: HAD family hydrolase, partial [Gemmiger sp.]
MMEYRLLALDIDGTLRPGREPRVPRENVLAVQAVQRAGVRVAIATGRGSGNVPAKMLRGIRPDYWICSAGAQVCTGAGAEVFTHRMCSEEMYALVDFFENYELQLGFDFEEGNYIYVGYEEMRRHHMALFGSADTIRDGEDQDRHLQSMPFKAFGKLPGEYLAMFREKYGYLGLNFFSYGNEGYCDITCAGTDKAFGLRSLCEATGIPIAQAVAVGDSENDCGILRAAGLGVCVADGCEAARRAADRLCPPAGEYGVAALCRELLPEA